ncbi:unnamed protein product [Cochlearia groenlandica]
MTTMMISDVENRVFFQVQRSKRTLRVPFDPSSPSEQANNAKRQEFHALHGGFILGFSPPPPPPPPEPTRNRKRQPSPVSLSVQRQQQRPRANPPLPLQVETQQQQPRASPPLPLQVQRHEEPRRANPPLPVQRQQPLPRADPPLLVQRQEQPLEANPPLPVQRQQPLPRANPPLNVQGQEQPPRANPPLPAQRQQQQPRVDLRLAIGPIQPIPAPAWLLPWMARKNGTNPKRVIEKTLTKTDVAEGQNRLAIPLRRILDITFLRPEEKRIVEGTDLEGLDVKLMVSEEKEFGLNLRRWKMNNTFTYNLVKGWKSVIKGCGLTNGYMIDLWSFHVDDEVYLAFVPPNPPN